MSVPRRDVTIMLGTTFVVWLGQRITAVAMPLVALAASHSAWSTGLVGGMAGLPLVTAPWWARRGWQRLTSGRAIGLVLAGQVAGLLIVPIAAIGDRVSWYALAATGLVSGCCTALAGPAQRSLLAEIAEPLGGYAAAKALAWQDFAHRSSMVVAPALGALAVGAWGPVPLLWCEAAGVAAGALLLTTVRARSSGAGGTAREPVARLTMRAALRAHPSIAVGVAMSGVGGLAWFAFTLGLAVRGAEVARPGALIAAAMTGYGFSSVLSALASPRLLPRLPWLATAAAAWVGLGLMFVGEAGAGASVPLIAAIAAVGGLLAPLGNGSLDALIGTRTTGAERRTAFAAAGFVHDGSVSVGLVVGGTVIGLAGTTGTLLVTGVAQIVAGAAGLIWRAHRRASRPADDAASAGGRRPALVGPAIGQRTAPSPCSQSAQASATSTAQPSSSSSS
jgi:hypothetical protein